MFLFVFYLFYLFFFFAMIKWEGGLCTGAGRRGGDHEAISIRCFILSYFVLFYFII